MSSTFLQTEHLVTGYTRPRRGAVALTVPVTLTLREGDLVCLLGANGIGKSTLLRTLAGMQAPLSGVVRLRGDVVHALRPDELARRLAVVLTDRIAVAGLSAYGLVALGRYPHTGWAGRLEDDDHRAIRQALDDVRARHFAGRLVDELSDGERQKVMIARALAQETPLMILDEITAFLDLPRRVDIMALLRDLAHQHGKAVLVSTHDLELALRTADAIWLVSAGGCVDVGTPEELVLNGALARAFQSDGIGFDPRTGAFHVQRRHARRVRLTGDGLVAHWTAQALIRYGFDVEMQEDAPAPDSARVEVVPDGAGCRWIATVDGRRHEYNTLSALTQFVRGQISSRAS